MKVVVTGATGFVGQEIVPGLLKSGAEVMLAGRNPVRLLDIFPETRAIAYEDIAIEAQGFDVLVHLAALNNDVDAPLADFRRINVDFMLEVAQSARAAGIDRFLNFSTFHALDESDLGAYAQSKREAASALQSVDIRSATLYLPAVYGRRWSGKLAVLNALPRWMARSAFVLLSAMKPTVDAQRISDFIIDDFGHSSAGSFYLFDDKDGNAAFKLGKRLVDLSFAVTAIVLLWWLFIGLWICIRLQSEGPGIFAQTRVGQHGKPFTCYKFRTMAFGTRQAGTHEVSVSAVTRIGGFLRRTKLDELPQVWNILKNEVSLVGPRPCLPGQTELVACRVEANVLRMKPGITGYAQVNDVDMSDPVRLTRFDARYGMLRSLMFDLRVLLATVMGRGQGDRTTG